MDTTAIIMGAGGLVLAGLMAYFVTKSASSGGLDLNAAVGIRTKLSKSSQEAWEAAHRAALPITLMACRLTIVAAFVSVAAAIFADTAGFSPVLALAFMAAGYVGFVVLMCLAARAGNRAVRALPSQR